MSSFSMKPPNAITCKAAVAYGAGEALVIEEVEVSPPQPMEIRIKVFSTSLCRSDITAWSQAPIFPRIFGHEASGNGILLSAKELGLEIVYVAHLIVDMIKVYGACEYMAKAENNPERAGQYCFLPFEAQLGLVALTNLMGFGIGSVCLSQDSPFAYPGPIAIIFSPFAVIGHTYGRLLACFTWIVESLGEGVTEFQEGDHVLALFTGECMTCRHCTSGKSNMCQVLGLERKGVMHSDQKTRFSVKGKPVYHYCAVSSFSEYTVVHSGCALKVSTLAPLDKICLLSCGVSAGLGAAWKVANITKGSTVVIFGLGTVGLSVAQGAKQRGASRIIGVDINPEKAEKGKAFGITEFINPHDYHEPVQQVIKQMTDGGADYSFECVGDTGMVTTALQSCCDGWGLTVTLGVPKVNPEISTHYALFLSGRTLKGSLFGGWKPKSDLHSLVDMYMRKEIQIDEFITHDLPFEDINKAFDLMIKGKCLRCVIHMPN